MQKYHETHIILYPRWSYLLLHQHRLKEQFTQNMKKPTHPLLPPVDIKSGEAS